MLLLLGLTTKNSTKPRLNELVIFCKNLLLAWTAKKRFDDALVIARLHRKVQPQNLTGYYTEALTLFSLGRYDEARGVLLNAPEAGLQLDQPVPELRAQQSQRRHLGDFEILLVCNRWLGQPARPQTSAQAVTGPRQAPLDGHHLPPDRHASTSLQILKCIAQIEAVRMALA